MLKFCVPVSVSFWLHDNLVLVHLFACYNSFDLELEELGKIHESYTNFNLLREREGNDYPES
jgi:hypothetical protein